jgi:hypothetical protein
MNDVVIAVYLKVCYAGETTLRLVDVLLGRMDTKYESDKYVLKAMYLTDISEDE